jgi:ubiquitin carboxyl-terminal hydrolase 10
LQQSTISVELPAKDTQRKDNAPSDETRESLQTQSIEVPGPGPSEPQTPTTSHAPSETDSTHPTTPSSAVPPHSSLRPQSQPQAKKQAPPLVPVVPIFPQSPITPRQPPKEADTQPISDASHTTAETVKESADAVAGSPVQSPVSPPAPPKSWADLVRSKGQPRVANLAETLSGAEAGGLSAPRSESLVDVLNSLGSDVEQYGDKIAFLEPRGLVNTGNMCYMNSVRR